MLLVLFAVVEAAGGGEDEDDEDDDAATADVDRPHERFPAVGPAEESRRRRDAEDECELLVAVSVVVLPRRAVAVEGDVEEGAAVDEDRWKLGTDSESTIVAG